MPMYSERSVQRNRNEVFSVRTSGNFNLRKVNLRQSVLQSESGATIDKNCKKEFAFTERSDAAKYRCLSSNVSPRCADADRLVLWEHIYQSRSEKYHLVASTTAFAGRLMGR